MNDFSLGLANKGVYDFGMVILALLPPESEFCLPPLIGSAESLRVGKFVLKASFSPEVVRKSSTPIGGVSDS